MKTIKNYKDYEGSISKESIINMDLASMQGIPAMLVECSDDYYVFMLTSGFEVHMCNEFLRSLKIERDYEPICFQSYHQYSRLISSIMKAIRIERKINSAGISYGCNVFVIWSVLMTEMSNKYHTNVVNDSDNFSRYVKEAIVIAERKEKSWETK
jgi:hypothetical protein